MSGVPIARAGREELGGHATWCVTLLLLAQACLLFGSQQYNYVTYDEAAHIPAGLVCWREGDFSLYRTNPPFARLVSAVPVMLACPRFDWKTPQSIPGERPEWSAADAFAVANGERYFTLVRLARLPGLLWAAVGGLIVYHWTRQLYGPLAGLVSLALWSFEPTVLAHAQLATPDVPGTVLGVGAGYAFWRYLDCPSARRVAVAGLVLGLGALTKFTLLLFYPLGVAALFLHRGLNRSSAAHALLLLGLGLFVINAGYAFKDTGRPLGSFPFVSRAFAGSPGDGSLFYHSGRSGNRFRETALGRVPVPLPADYLLGIDLQKRDFEELGRVQPSYLAGSWRVQGWWYFYLYALAVKVPLATLLLVVWGVAAGWFRTRRERPRLREHLLWMPAVAVLAAVSSQTGLQHFRYALPLFPYVIILTGRVACCHGPGRVLPIVVAVALVAWTCTSSLAPWPHHLAYCNEIGGGPANGHAHLLDSNYDWGQDLLVLKAWLDEHPEARPLGLAYYNTVDPRMAGIEFHPPPPAPNHLFPHDPLYSRTLGPQPGYYAISVNYLHGMPGEIADGQGGWRRVPPDEFRYFQSFQPMARAGHTIFIYHLDREEVNAVRQQLGLAPID